MQGEERNVREFANAVYMIVLILLTLLIAFAFIDWANSKSTAKPFIERVNERKEETQEEPPKLDCNCECGPTLKLPKRERFLEAKGYA